MIDTGQTGRCGGEQLSETVFFENDLVQVGLSLSKVEFRLGDDQSMLVEIAQLKPIAQHMLPHLSLCVVVGDESFGDGQQVEQSGVVLAFVDLVANEQTTSFALHLAHTIGNEFGLRIAGQSCLDAVTAIVQNQCLTVHMDDGCVCVDLR